ncbi:MAG: SoxR reducing system RseC family protein [Pseudomonadales bacterium]|jgi:sigma-E factor negative regulatory protein RseC
MSNAQSCMIEQVAHVHAIDQTTVWLETLRRATCDSCTCGQRLLNEGADTAHSRIELPIPKNMTLNVGDEVVLGVHQKAFIKASLLTFVMPLIIMLACAVLAQWLALSEPLTVVAALLGLGLGLFLLRWYSQNAAALGSDQWQPVILRQQRLSQVQEMHFTSE